MKKILFIVALAMSISSMAQKNSVTVTPRIGMNIATMTNSDGAESRYGFVGGIEIEKMLNKSLALSIGALYSQQGVCEEVDNVDSTIKMDYINFPVLFNYYLTNKLIFRFGVQPGFLINDKVKVSSNGMSAEMGIEKALANSGVNATCEKIVFSMPIGLAYDLNCGLEIDARWNLPLSAAVKAPGEDTKHKVFSISLGYKF